MTHILVLTHNPKSQEGFPSSGTPVSVVLKSFVLNILKSFYSQKYAGPF